MPAREVDVIVTTFGGLQTARAVDAGGGLVGIRSSESPPATIEIEFIDWPFQLDNPSLDAHIDLVADHRPKYAVAPDVEKGRSLDDVLEVARELQQYAEHVIVVPKDVPVAAVPDEYVVGVPFRDEWDTDTGVNEYADFRGRRVHILGGNATDQFELADRFDYDVGSVDSPNPLAWADGGRIWVARLGGADEVRKVIVQEIANRTVNEEDAEKVWAEFEAMGYEDMPIDDLVAEVEKRFGMDSIIIDPEVATALDLPTDEQLLRSRYHRIRFTVMNLIEAWNDDRRVTKPFALAPGRGPPPPAPEGLEEDVLEMAPGEFQTREERLERFLQTTDVEEMDRLEGTERGLALFAEEAEQARPALDRTVVLVGCGDAKHSGVHRGRELYSSGYFTLKRRYAEEEGDEWYILSAKHGVIEPDELIACYDKSIIDVDPDAWAEMVIDQLGDVSDARVIVLAGSDYLDPILSGLLRKAGRVEIPTRGMGMIDRMKWLSANTPE